jgi:hypothetical protein
MYNLHIRLRINKTEKQDYVTFAPDYFITHMEGLCIVFNLYKTSKISKYALSKERCLLWIIKQY